MRISFPLWLLFLLTIPDTLHGQAETPLDSMLMEASSALKSAAHETAYNLFLQCLDKAEKENRRDRLSAIYYNLAVIQHYNEANDKSAVYLKKAGESARLVNDSSDLARALLLQGVVFFYLNQMDSSIISFASSAEIFSAIGEKGRAAFAASKIGNILEANGQFREATPYFRRQLEETRSANDSLGVLSAHINMATNSLNLKNYSEGLLYIDSAKSLATQLNRLFEYKECLRSESLLLEKAGRTAEALAVLHEYLVVQDSFLSNEKSSQIAEMEARFESAQKENTIRQQHISLLWSRRALIGATVALLLFGLAGFLLYRLTRQLRKRNAEKELLVKEIHHRVKNNLQILSSLLYLQSRQIHDSAALEAVREGQSRVEAMSLIHQKLYMGDNLVQVDMNHYLKELGDMLLDAFGRRGDGAVQIRQRVEDIQLDVDTAIPLGLIANELLTNALKYAFPDGRTGVVDIVLQRNNDGSLVFEVGDDGVGVAPTPEGNTGAAAFGTRLVDLLSQKLKGKPEKVAQDNGHRVRIRFEEV